ncbi:outer membrane protein assembly factor BamB family protein [Streptomyces sp. NPDC002454]
MSQSPEERTPAEGSGIPNESGQPPMAPAPFGPPSTPPSPAPFGAAGAAPAPGPYQAPGPYGQPAGYGPPPTAGPYGQPVPPPGPYAQSGPYGAQPGPPTVPTPGYGQPGPYGHQHYGAGGHGQPPHPPQAPAPGGRGPFRGRTGIVLAAVAALVVVVGGTVLALGAGDEGDDPAPKEPTPVAGGSTAPAPSASASVDQGDGKGAGGSGAAGDGVDVDELNEGREDGESRVLWYRSAPKVPGSGAEAPGLWVTDDLVVKAAYKQVVGYDATGGEPRWTVELPQKVCAVVPRPTGDGKVVVAHMSGVSDRAKCNQLQQIDLGTGAKGWTQKVSEGGLFDSSVSIALHLVGDTLVVGRSMSGIGYDVDTGKRRFEVGKHGTDCFPNGFTGGARLLMVAGCGAGGDNQRDEVRQLDPKTGKVLWSKKFPKGWKVTRALSVDPVVLYLTNEEKKQWNVTALQDGSAAVRSQLSLKEQPELDCGWAGLTRELQGCTGVVADADTLYLATKAKSSANELLAVSLDTGKEKWRTGATYGRSLQPLRIEDGRVLSYERPSHDRAGAVTAIEVTGGAPRVLLKNPDGAAALERSFFQKAVAYEGGRLYLSTTMLSSTKNGAEQKLMMAFGP